MKVLVFMTQFYQLGGSERLAVELAEELNKRGIHTDLLSMYCEDLPGVAEAKEALLRRGIPAVHFLGLRVHPHVASMLPAVTRLRRLIRDHEYDVVETSMISPTVLATWAVRGMRTRLVVGLHQVFRRDRENAWTHAFLRLSVRSNPSNRYYAISDYVAERWISYSGTAPRHTRRIYNGVRDDYFQVGARRIRDTVRGELQTPQGVRLALYVGRLAACKGIDTLFDALGPIAESANLHVLHAGLPDFSVEGTREMIRKMKDRMAHERWGHRIRFLGYREDIPELMASCDVLVHPSRTEGFGLTLVEAMAVGLPVVATDIEGIPEVLAGTDSMMVPSDDPISLREAVIATLNRSADQQTAAISKGRQRASQFTAAIRIENMITLFEDVIHGRL